MLKENNVFAEFLSNATIEDSSKKERSDKHIYC